jgi:phage host-nuclease inhibitor protein Gam
MARKKEAALDVPASREEATSLVVDYVHCDRVMLETKLRYEQMIDKLKADRDQHLSALQNANAGRFASLKAWWEAGGMEIAGKGRSADLAGAKLGIRLTPPSVKLRRGLKAADVLAWLGSIRWSEAKRFRRTKVELDKEAIIKAVRTEEDIRTVFEGQGVTVVQVDEFFIDTSLDEEAIRTEIAAA